MTPTATIALEVPDLAGLRSASDHELIEWTRRWGEARRLADSGLSRLAAEVGRRSSLEQGHDGLAQRSGMRTPDALVSSLTGTSGAEARALVAVGAMMDAPSAWLAEVATGVGSGDVSIGAAAAIKQGLGAPSADVAADDLADAAHTLVVEAATLPPEKVARRARELRDQLDADGVADREELLRRKRFLRLTPLPDGMTRVSGLLDPESAALVTDAIDLVTAPRRGGPRFVDETQQARADAIVKDSRTTEQLTLDAVVEMIRIAGSADEGRVFGTRKPGVRVHVTVADLDRRAGAAHLEGQSASVSIASVQRRACADGYLPILFDGCGRALNLGRTQRLFSEKQRIVLAAIWGGCAIPGCDRPPSWTEAHHADEWDRHNGSTDVCNGILLCRHHHMMVHNQRWRIRRRGPEFWLDPPPDDSLMREPVLLESKNPLRRRAAVGAIQNRPLDQDEGG
jgi:hypothetical protein